MAGTPLTDSIEALTTYANQATGASDTNLSDAVYTLAQGYGGSDLLWKTTLTENSYRITYDISDNAFTKYNALLMVVYVAAGSNIDWFYGYFNNLNDSAPYSGIVSGNIPSAQVITLKKEENGWKCVNLSNNSGPVKQPEATGNYFGARCYANGKYFAAGTIAYVIGIE